MSNESRRNKVTQRMLLNEEFLAITLWASQSPLPPKYNYLQHSQTHKTLSNHPLNKEYEHLQSTPPSLNNIKNISWFIIEYAILIFRLILTILRIRN